MERERKRKRAEKGEEVSDDKMRRKARAAVAVELESENEKSAGVAPPPTEEEVEEFFTILRRMRVAVKYFEKGGASNINKSGVDLQLNKTTAAPADAVKVGGKRVVNGGFDLNSVPETESSSV